MADLAKGTVFAGHRIEGVAGKGGMGVVYRATHLALDHVVALKVISPALASDKRFRSRFEEESRIAVSIRHPNVVPIHHAGEEDGLLFVTMDLIDGSDLRVLLNREGALEPRHAARIIAAVADALDAAHARGLVHRDIKPGNVLIEGSGESERVFLTDFGLARHVEASTGITATGAFVGTLDYVAPEQIRGERVDARADVYALGCVLFELLTGNPPFAARDDKVAKMYAHLEEEPPSLRVLRPDLPGGLDPILRRALAKDPGARFPSAGDFARAVEAAVQGEATVEAERSVGVGAAAPGPPEATTSVEREQVEPPEPAPPPSTEVAPAAPPATVGRPAAAAQARGRGPLIAAAAGVAGVVVAVILIAGGGGDGDSTTTTPTGNGQTTVDDGGGNAPPAPKANVDGDPVPVGTLPVNPFHGEKGLYVNNRKGNSVSFVDGDPASERNEFPAGDLPEAVVEAAGSLWVSQGRGNSVLRLDPETGAVQAEIEVGVQPAGMAVDSDDNVWVANFGGDTVTKIEPASQDIRDIEVGEAPYGIAFEGGAVWVSNREGDSITRITADSGRPDPQPVAVGDNPKGIAVDADGKVWVANSAEDTVSIVDNGAEQDRIQVGTEPRGVVFAFGSIWVSVAGTDEAVRIDPRDAEIIQRVDVGVSPEGITAGPKSVWVANGADSTLTRIDPGG